LHEFHAWIGLAQSPGDDDVESLLEAGVAQVQDLAAGSVWHDAVFDVRNLNGQYFLTATGLVNRRREEGHRLEELLSLVAERLPGSWGLVYERDDEMPHTPGPNGFRVRVISRGVITEASDPFLSPCNPVIED
jgi:Immunity protein 7